MTTSPNRKDSISPRAGVEALGMEGEPKSTSLHV
jgi:hypothetical protein